MNTYNEILKQARKLMASGLSGRDLALELAPSLESLSTAQRKRLSQRISSEHYVLGHSLHDPNMFDNCRQAKASVENSPNRHYHILTYRTAECSGCTHRKGSTCGLIGGKLVSSLDDIPESAASQTAELVSNETGLPVSDGLRRASKATPADKIARIHQIRLAGKQESTSQETRDHARSRTASAILDNTNDFHVNPKKLTGPSRSRNAEALEINDFEEDESSKEASSYEDIMASADLDFTIPSPRTSSKMPFLDPERETAVPARQAARNSATLEEESNAVQKNLILATRKASFLFANGKMNTDAATKISRFVEKMIESGAHHTSQSRAIHHQLLAQSGSLEL